MFFRHSVLWTEWNVGMEYSEMDIIPLCSSAIPFYGQNGMAEQYSGTVIRCR